MRLDPHLEQIVRKVFGHLLRQRRDQHAVAAVDRELDLVHEVVDLVLRWPHFDDRIDEARRPDDLFHHLRRALDLVVRRRRAHEDALVDVLVELLEGQWPVIDGARQPEAKLHERILAPTVTEELALHLRQRHVRFIHDQ